jgi:hypothetical protein
MLPHPDLHPRSSAGGDEHFFWTADNRLSFIDDYGNSILLERDQPDATYVNKFVNGAWAGRVDILHEHEYVVGYVLVTAEGYEARYNADGELMDCVHPADPLGDACYDDSGHGDTVFAMSGSCSALGWTAFTAGVALRRFGWNVNPYRKSKSLQSDAGQSGARYLGSVVRGWKQFRSVAGLPTDGRGVTRRPWG